MPLAFPASQRTKMLSSQAIIDALRVVKYPGYSRDIVSFGLIKEAVERNNTIHVRIHLNSNAPGVAEQIKLEAARALAAISGNKKLDIEIFAPQNAGAPVANSPFAGQSRVSGIKRIIAVASGKGGVGKSTCSVNLTCAMKELGARAGLLDCDIYGPSIPLMMGVHEKPGLSADETQMLPPRRFEIPLMSMGFLVEDDSPVIWRGPMIVKTIQQFIHQVAWGDLDYLFVDLPPGTGDAQLTLCQTVPLDGGVIVTTPQEASLGVVRKGIAMFEKVNVPILGIIENMSYFTAPGGQRIEIFGHGGGKSEATRQNIPFLGEIPIFPEIREAGDRGMPIVIENPKSPSAQAFFNIARQLSSRFSK